jgi:outer membrane lipoprotein
MQLWGGVIVEVRNLEDSTWIEVVSYPLRRQQPLSGGITDGRFLLRAPGFLDPVDHRVGRRLTARGRISGFEDGRIGEVLYRFPVLEVDELHLWPDGPDVERGGWGGVRFGIGIGIGL